MLPPIFAVCAATPAVTALLGTTPVRLFPFGEAPQGAAKPYALWQVITGSPENYLADRPDMDGWTLQIDVYADTGVAATNVATAIRHAIETRANVVRYGGTNRDRETRDFHVSFDVSWLNPR